jgi:putative transposase
MNRPKCTEYDYIQFLIAAQTAFTCTEAATSQPEQSDPPAHDAFTRLLQRQPPDTAALWREVASRVFRHEGVLVLDDTTLDKPYARKMELVTHHWSGKHRRVVQGINLQTLLWSDAEIHLPIDCRVYDKPHDPLQGQTKNEHLRAMLQTAHERGFQAEYVLFDGWYAALENLKPDRPLGLALPDPAEAQPAGRPGRPRQPRGLRDRGACRRLHGAPEGLRLRAAVPNARPRRRGGALGAHHLAMSETERAALATRGWAIETYHRQIKQYCGIEKAQCRSARAQMNHLLFSLRAYVRLEAHRFCTGISLHEAKLNIIRDAVRHYLAQPRYTLSPTA